jgi:hypothetical protein
MCPPERVSLKPTGSFTWGHGVLDHHIAPGISSFDAATIPDIRSDHPEAPHWLANLFLNSVLRSKYKDGVRHAVIGFLRRTSHAFRAYHDAREATLEYLDGLEPGKPNLTKYFAAVVAWETCVLQLNMAVAAIRAVNGEKLYEKNDGSPLQRIYDTANNVKHFPGELGEGAEVQPLWLTNSGLASFGIEVTYEELAAELGDFAEFANQIQDPISFREAVRGESGDADQGITT